MKIIFLYTLLFLSFTTYSFSMENTKTLKTIERQKTSPIIIKVIKHEKKKGILNKNAPFQIMGEESEIEIPKKKGGEIIIIPALKINQKINKNEKANLIKNLLLVSLKNAQQAPTQWNEAFRFLTEEDIASSSVEQLKGGGAQTAGLYLLRLGHGRQEHALIIKQLKDETEIRKITKIEERIPEIVLQSAKEGIHYIFPLANAALINKGKTTYYTIMSMAEGIQLSKYIKEFDNKYQNFEQEEKEVFQSNLRNFGQKLAIAHWIGISSKTGKCWDLTSRLVHGDLHADNVFIKENGSLDIIENESLKDAINKGRNVGIDLRKFIGMLCCGLNTSHRHAPHLLENNDDFYIYLVKPFLKGYLQQIFELVKQQEGIGNQQNMGLFSMKLKKKKKKSDCFEQLWSKLYDEICQTNSIEAWMEDPRTALDFTGTYRQARKKIALLMDEVYEEFINEGTLPPPLKTKKKVIIETEPTEPKEQNINLSQEVISSESSIPISEPSINPSQEDFPPFETRKQFWIDKQKEEPQVIFPTEEELIKKQKRRQIAFERFKEMQDRHKLEEEKRTNILNRSKVALKHFKNIEDN